MLLCRSTTCVGGREKREGKESERRCARMMYDDVLALEENTNEKGQRKY